MVYLKQFYKLIENSAGPVLVLMCFFLFKTPLEGLLNVLFSTPVGQYVISSLINDVVFICFVVWFVIWNMIKVSRLLVFPSDFFKVSLILCLVYSWYRFVDTQVWQFQHFSRSTRLYYFDILYVLLVVPIIFLVRLVIQHPADNLNRSEFIEDISVNADGKDLLNLEHYAKELADRLNVSYFRNSYAIGITGKWGSGKTSFLNLIKKNLEGESKIIFDFNPWSSHGASSVTLDFFKAMRGALKSYDYSLGNTMINYAHSLVDAYGNSFTRLFWPFKEQLSLSEQHKKIDQLLVRMDKQIIVFIDDLDRLDKSELVEVMKLIRNTANFHNVVFIVAYDRNYLVNSIKEINDYQSEFYLEKIFQIEVPLPTFERRLLLSHLADILLKYLGDEGKEKIHELVYGVRFGNNTYLEDTIVTMRDVVRFSNSFLLNIKKLEGEVLMSEIFKLELLKLKFPTVYELLARRRNLFLNAVQENADKYVYKLKPVKDWEQTLKLEYDITPRAVSQVKRVDALWYFLRLQGNSF